MVLVQIQQIDTAQILVQSAATLATHLKKDFGLFSFVDNDTKITNRENELKTIFPTTTITVRRLTRNSTLQMCEDQDASFLFIQMFDYSSKSIRGALNSCRELRIPYVLFKDSFTLLDMTKVILPIGFLEEEMEKAQFASAFGRFCNTEIKMLLANDYGSKAAANATKMKDLFDKFKFSYNLEKATKDSFKVEIESIQVAENEQAGMIIVSASRDYGLDDIIFGPKEYKVVKKSPIPILLINPRGDLYALCD